MLALKQYMSLSLFCVLFSPGYFPLIFGWYHVFLWTVALTTVPTADWRICDFAIWSSKGRPADYGPSVNLTPIDELTWPPFSTTVRRMGFSYRRQFSADWFVFLSVAIQTGEGNGSACRKLQNKMESLQNLVETLQIKNQGTENSAFGNVAGQKPTGPLKVEMDLSPANKKGPSTPAPRS